MSNDGSGTKEPYCTRKKRALEGSTYYTPIIIIIIEWKVPFLSFRFCKREVLSRHWFTQTSHLQLSGNSYIIVCIYIYTSFQKSNPPTLGSDQLNPNATQHSRGGFGPHLFGICSCDWKGKMIFPPWMCFKGPRASIPRRWLEQVAECSDLTGWLKSWPLQFGTDSMEFEEDAVWPKWSAHYHTQGTGSELFSIALLKHRCMRCICWSYKIYSSQIYKRRVKNTLALCMESRQNLPGMIQLPSKTSFSVTS